MDNNQHFRRLWHFSKWLKTFAILRAFWLKGWQTRSQVRLFILGPTCQTISLWRVNWIWQQNNPLIKKSLFIFRLIMLNTFSVQMLSTCGRLFVWNILFFLFALPAEVNVEERHKSPQRFTGSIFPSLSNSHKTDWFNSIKNNQRHFRLPVLNNLVLK